MASYREHLTTSSVLGVGVGVGATLLGGFTPVQGALAGILTGLGGILPDLDSESGRPVRELFGLTAALCPVMLMPRLEAWGGNSEAALLLAVLVYVAVRYGGALVLGLAAVHRGMFHSLPAAVIAGELAFLGYPSPFLRTRLLMAVGVCLGYLSHLILDEIYAVEWRGARLKLNKFSGSATKFLGRHWGSNIVTYGLLFTLTYGIVVDGGLLRPGGRVEAQRPSPLNLRVLEQPGEDSARR